MKTKVCTECGIEKSYDDFHCRPERPIGIKSKCKVCSNKLRKKHYDADKKSGKLKEIIWSRAGINITYEEYIDKYNTAKGCCEICGKQFDVLCVDHNHQTNEIRGLLCTLCNLAIENFDESVKNMNNAIKYLKKYGGRNV